MIPNDQAFFSFPLRLLLPAQHGVWGIRMPDETNGRYAFFQHLHCISGVQGGDVALRAVG
jgi:hypothetical protein